MSCAEEERRFRAFVEQRLRARQPGWSWNGPRIPNVKPHFLLIVADAEGRIWARVYDPNVSFDPARDVSRSDQLWDVFEVSGTYLGRVRTGPGVMPYSARGNFLWTILRDSNDVQRVARMRIIWGPQR